MCECVCMCVCACVCACVCVCIVHGDNRTAQTATCICSNLSHLAKWSARFLCVGVSVGVGG